MPPRIRSFLPRPPFAREQKASAPAAPRVFREFVETLQRLDAAQPPAPGTEKRRPARPRPARRGYVGNGHKRPSRSRS